MRHRNSDSDERLPPADPPPSPGPAVLGALADDAIDVFCWCNKCGHNAIVPSRLLIRQLGPAMPVPAVGAHMRCSGCGSRDIATRPAWPSAGPIARHD
jgi:hypothetical protein